MQAAPKLQRRPRNRLAGRGTTGALWGCRLLQPHSSNIRKAAPVPGAREVTCPVGKAAELRGDDSLPRPSRNHLETWSRIQHLSLKENGGI